MLERAGGILFLGQGLSEKGAGVKEGDCQRQDVPAITGQCSPRELKALQAGRRHQSLHGGFNILSKAQMDKKNVSP